MSVCLNINFNLICRSKKSTIAAATPAGTELHAMMRLEGTAALVLRDLQDMTAKQVRLILLVDNFFHGIHMSGKYAFESGNLYMK